MRSALLFANRVLLPAFVLVYVLAMLAASCMPLSDTMGEAQAVPRWEYWLLYASVPSAIWWQWTGGLQPVYFVDRIPIFALSLAWITACWSLGTQISTLDPVSNRLSKYERIGVSILLGQAVLSTVVFLTGWLLGLQSVAMGLVGISIAIAFWRFRASQIKAEQTLEPDRVEITTTLESDVDPSFASSIRRRMIGLLVLATVFLIGFQVYGATMPSHDSHVREVDWWLVKHTALDGRIRWATDHALVNAPAGLDMSAVAFVSFLTFDLQPSIRMQKQSDSIASQESWNRRTLTGVLAGKTTNAMLCLIGVMLVSIHLGRRHGFLPGLYVAFLLVATPGIAELIRLGRSEALTGVWCSALAIVWQASSTSLRKPIPLGIVWGLLVGGAFGSGYAAAVLAGVPASVLWLSNSWRKREASKAGMSKLVTAAIAVGVTLTASSFYIRNAIASGDPIYPWSGVVAQQVGIIEKNEFRDAIRFASRVPAETIAESMAAENTDSIAENVKRDRWTSQQSPYRFINLQDGLIRLFGNSNAHGLTLIPFALVGVLIGGIHGRYGQIRVAGLWFVSWISIWWLFFTRQDRDWVGALVLLAWPAALGAEWLLERARGYYMMLLVSITIVWAVVVLPVWPTSDNRILVSLDTLSRRANFPVSDLVDEPPFKTNLEPEQNEQLDYASILRSSLKGTINDETVLLVGESDDFDFLSECYTNGPFEEGLLGRCIGLKASETDSMLRSRGVRLVLVVWSGVRYREKLIGRNLESEYRSTINNLVSESFLKPIPWEISSSHAELFRVNEEQ